ncbi:hypothetical protein CDD81_4190 [Ophiocordyceps australis]|uniref:Uncharacterized protein n=1 Tax=Ophiocordyceps australis TaxID=1399860 RepID=A0A2C5XAG8_9HYPO|nr:hypothetical protein CDD81_4190 [Ophiocordyceps australis]
MLHPIQQPNPFADPSTRIKSLGRLFSTSNHDANPMSTCHGSNADRHCKAETENSNKENMDQSCRDETLEHHSRARLDGVESSAWHTKPPPFLYNNPVFPSYSRDMPLGWDGAPLKQGDYGGESADAESVQRTAMPSPNSDLLLTMVKEKLRLEDDAEKPFKSSRERSFRARSASSEYPPNDMDISRIQSPASAAHVNHLSLSDLSRFGRGNDRLSYLHSSSNDSSAQPARAAEAGTVGHKTSTPFSPWQQDARQVQPKPTYNHYELVDSNDVLPCDSLSQCKSPQLSTADGQDFMSGHQAAVSRRESMSQGWESVESMTKHRQYDGAADDSWCSGSPKPDSPPPVNRLSKRKASHFSLRSLSQSLAKRPRLTDLQKWAHHVCRDSTRRLSKAYHRWRQQRVMQRQQFEAWKANRRRERPADPLKGKTERGFGVFSIERTRHGNEEWWKEGVAKYQAPEWMLFQK